MPSSLIVEVCLIDEVKPHPNADRVELVKVKNWQVVAPIDHFKTGDKAVFIQPDLLIPEVLADRWGIAKYCPVLPKQIDGQRPPFRRIKAQHFRGEKSFGTVQKLDDPAWPVGMSVAEHYGVTKYEPPTRFHRSGKRDGDAASHVLAFHQYTHIEHLNNFPNVIQPDEEIIVSEKLHGMQTRFSLILHPNEEGVATWQYMAGSHHVRRKEFNEKGIRSMFWEPFDDKIKEMLVNIKNKEQAKEGVIIFGELYGELIQDMGYGVEKAFRAFDIAVDGKYLDFDKMIEYCVVDTVPYLYRGKFSLEKVAELTDGPTTLCKPEDAGKFKGREGVVVRLAKERYNRGRIIFKSVSVDYYERF